MRKGFLIGGMGFLLGVVTGIMIQIEIEMHHTPAYGQPRAVAGEGAGGRPAVSKPEAGG